MDAIYNVRTQDYPAPTQPLTGITCRRFSFPNNPTLIGAIQDVLVYLTQPEAWTGDELDRLRAMSAISQALLGINMCEDDDMPIGTIALFISETPPTGWLVCNGQVYQRTDYPELYDILPAAQYHVSETEFNTPDLRQRFVRGADEEFPVGTHGGNNEGSNDSNVAVHSHSFQFPEQVTVNVELGATPITVLNPESIVGYNTDEAGAEDYLVIPEFTAFNWIIRAK